MNSINLVIDVKETVKAHTDIYSNPNINITLPETSIRVELVNVPQDLVAQLYELKSQNQAVNYDLSVQKTENERLKVQIDSLQQIIYRNISEEVKTKVLEHIKAGHKIDAIKEVRTLLPLGLKEAKDYVDSLVKENVPAPGSFAEAIAEATTDSLAQF